MSDGTKSFSGAQINNAGAATWTAGNFNSRGGAIFNNQAGATFDTDFNGNFAFNQGGVRTQFNNAGTFTKSGGTGTTTFSTALNNSGTVNVDSGTLAFNGGYTQTAGVLSLDGGDVSSTSVLAIQGGQIIGDGTLFADVNNTGGTISPGFSAGQLTVDGDLDLGSGSDWFMEIGGLAQSTQ